jgi:hypothetical protein
MKEQLLNRLENSKNYTIAVLRAMPDSFLNFRPATTLWSFTEQFNHIAYGLDWWHENYILKTELVWNPPLAKLHKDEIVSLLENAFNTIKVYIGNHEITEQIIYGFDSTLDHVSHHRGQATIYLRCKGITPPEYIY